MPKPKDVDCRDADLVSQFVVAYEQPTHFVRFVLFQLFAYSRMLIQSRNRGDKSLHHLCGSARVDGGQKFEVERDPSLPCWST